LKRHSNRPLTSAQQRALEGDVLTEATAANIADPTNAEKRRQYHAALIGRCASASAAAVVGLHERVEGMRIELAELWAQVDKLRAAQSKSESKGRG
jgi:hypothetical protein